MVEVKIKINKNCKWCRFFRIIKSQDEVCTQSFAIGSIMNCVISKLDRFKDEEGNSKWKLAEILRKHWTIKLCINKCPVFEFDKSKITNEELKINCSVRGYTIQELESLESAANFFDNLLGSDELFDGDFNFDKLDDNVISKI